MTVEHDTKVCSKCGIEKVIADFGKRSDPRRGINSYCKQCDAEIHKAKRKALGAREIGCFYACCKCGESFCLQNGKSKYCEKCLPLVKKEQATKSFIKHRKQRLADAAKYRLKNNEEIKRKKREYHHATKDIRNAKSRASYAKNVEQNRENARQYRIKNKGAYSRYEAQRKAVDPLFNLIKRVRSRLGNALRNNGYTKRNKTREILGCSWEEFKIHIESQFRTGMTWENRSEWHIDHRIPLATAKTEEDVIRLNHYTNLQPLWAKDNLLKSDKLDFQL